jgi:hypothetical protein
VENLSWSFAAINSYTTARYGFKIAAQGLPVDISAWATEVCVGPD